MESPVTDMTDSAGQDVKVTNYNNTHALDYLIVKQFLSKGTMLAITHDSEGQKEIIQKCINILKCGRIPIQQYNHKARHSKTNKKEGEEDITRQ